jgi:hypothetical protein
MPASQRDNNKGKKAEARKKKNHDEYGPPPKVWMASALHKIHIWDIGNGKHRVFVGPEKALFQQLLKDESFRSHVNLVAIDEDHLIAEWSVYLEAILQLCSR